MSWLLSDKNRRDVSQFDKVIARIAAKIAACPVQAGTPDIAALVGQGVMLSAARIGAGGALSQDDLRVLSTQIVRWFRSLDWSQAASKTRAAMAVFATPASTGVASHVLRNSVERRCRRTAG